MLMRSARQLAKSSSRCFSTTRPAASGLCFDLSEEQRQIQNVTRKFVREEVVPKAAEKDKSQEYPWDWVNKMHSLGLLNAGIPTKYGGVGLSIIDESIVNEELGFGCSALGAINVANGLAQTPLILFGSDFLKNKYLTQLAEHPKLASYCATEPGAGSDLAALRTRAEKKGDKWVINGQKMWITNAGVSDWFTVFTRTDPDPKSPTSKAFTAFLVESKTPGVTIGRKEINMGQRCSDTRGILFEDVEVPEENVIGEVGKGFLVAMGTFDASRAPTAAVAVGIIQRCLEESTKYSMERKTFGVPIAQHQAVSMMISEMAMSVELGRLMVYKAAYEHTQGRKNTYFSSIAKAFGGDMAMKSAIDCVQVFGGNGFNTEYPAEKLMRDAKILQIYEGTSQIQRLVIFREWAGIMAKLGL